MFGLRKNNGSSNKPVVTEEAVLAALSRIKILISAAILLRLAS